MGITRFYVLFLIGMSVAVKLQFLRKIDRRLQFAASGTDYYFSCSVMGTSLQWGLNSATLGGYKVDDVGVSTVTNKSSFYVTSILLSAVPLLPQQSGAHFVSVLVISLPKPSTLQLNVSCTNNKVINFTNVTINPKYRGRRSGSIVNYTNRTIVLQYILSAPLLTNSSVLVHIFMCGTDSLSQLIGREKKRAIGFNDQDDVGATVSALFAEKQMVNIQAVLASRQPLETTSLVFILSDTNFTFICSLKSNKVQLLSQKEFPRFNSTNSMLGNNSSNHSSNHSQTTTQFKSPTTTAYQNFWTSYYSNESTTSETIGTISRMKGSGNLVVVIAVVVIGALVIGAFAVVIVIVLMLLLYRILKKRTCSRQRSSPDQQELCSLDSNEKQENRFISVNGVTTESQLPVTSTVSYFTDNGYSVLKETENTGLT